MGGGGGGEGGTHNNSAQTMLTAISISLCFSTENTMSNVVLTMTIIEL